MRAHCAIRRAPHATVIAARGEIDLSSCVRLRERLLARGGQGTTVLDLAGVGFCNLAGLKVLFEADRLARTGGSLLRFAAVPPAVSRVLELAGAVELFEQFPDVEAALKD
ncbi:MAG TPA: STAS domain-containing protein [Actinospica sp.]|nr:STAS domain-containing protein [Actinospica sp.]